MRLVKVYTDETMAWFGVKFGSQGQIPLRNFANFANFASKLFDRTGGYPTYRNRGFILDLRHIC